MNSETSQPTISAEVRDAITQLHDEIQKIIAQYHTLSPQEQSQFGKLHEDPRTGGTVTRIQLVNPFVWDLLPVQGVSTSDASLVGYLHLDGEIKWLTENGELILIDNELLATWKAVDVTKLTSSVKKALTAPRTLRRNTKFMREPDDEKRRYAHRTLEAETARRYRILEDHIELNRLGFGECVKDPNDNKSVFLRWTFKSGASSDYFTGNAYFYVVDGHGEVVLGTPDGRGQNMSGDDGYHQPSGALNGLADNIRAMRLPAPCTEDSIAELREEVEKTLQWCNETIAQGVFVCGHPKKHPNSDKTLRVWRMKDKRLEGATSRNRGELFSDGSIYWSMRDGADVLLNNTYLGVQSHEAVSALIEAVKSVRMPRSQKEISGQPRLF